jgi:hypothetical protein
LSTSVRLLILYLARALALGGTLVALLSGPPSLVLTAWVLLPFALTFPVVFARSTWLPAVLASLLSNGFGLLLYGNYLLFTKHTSTDVIGFLFAPAYHFPIGAISFALFVAQRLFAPLGRCTSCQRYLKPGQTLCADCARHEATAL